MCENELEGKYKALSQGRTVLESCLHLNLAEHLNSEIGLGTITSIDSANQWLRSSFLFRRIQKNPSHYEVALGKDSGGWKQSITWEERIREMVMLSVEKLQKSELIVREEGDDRVDRKLESTEYGDIMSKVSLLEKLGCLILLTGCSFTSSSLQFVRNGIAGMLTYDPYP